MRSWPWYSKVLFALAVLAFAWLVWPTPWRRSEVTVSSTRVIVRENRLTGRTQVRWVDLSEPSNPFARATWQDR
jgi:membrane protein implicated in regulation of membrane protease activity